jgi:nicotinamide-nucleotide amidase
MPDELTTLAETLGARLKGRGWLLATAESCTGGWIAKVVTDIAGSSGWLDRGFVTYSNAAKRDMLDVDPATLAAHGAVSEAVAAAMARGALAQSAAQIAVAVSGIAGPGGGSADKPVGMVCFGWALGDAVDTATQRFTGDRDAVRRQSVAHALRGLIERLDHGR